MKEIVWQPVRQNEYEFGVLLDTNFAKKMLKTPLSLEYQNRLNKLATEELKRHNTNWSNPYSFENNSCLISQIYLGQNGVWLAATRSSLDKLQMDELTEPLIYNSHNVDTSKQAWDLTAMFDLWIHYSDVLIKS